jgi:hypothetical protein
LEPDGLEPDGLESDGLGPDGLVFDGLVFDGLVFDGLETRRWNGTKSAFADCASAIPARRHLRATPNDVILRPVTPNGSWIDRATPKNVILRPATPSPPHAW